MVQGRAVTVEEVIDRIDAWRGRPVSIQPLTNGITNANFRVDVDDRAFVVRIPGASTELLAIDRANELHNGRIAAGLGIGPSILHHFPESGATVIEFLHGRPMTNVTLAEPEMPARIAATLRTLHGGPRFLRDFDMLALAERYRALVVRRGYALPVGWEACRPTVDRIAATLALWRVPAVPCHNDLLADNYIEQDGRLRLLDWEYSGNGDPTFELGNTCRELDYDDARLAELCRGLLRRRVRGAGRPRTAPVDRLRRRLGAVGGDPGGDLADRVRFRGVRGDAVAARRGGHGLAGVPALARGRHRARPPGSR